MFGVQGYGLRVQDLGFRGFQGLGFRIRDSGIWVKVSGFGIEGLAFQGFEFRVLGLRVWGLEFGVQGSGFGRSGYLRPVVYSSPIGCTSCIVKSVRSRRCFDSSPL